jgi:hypothetical protein
MAGAQKGLVEGVVKTPLVAQQVDRRGRPELAVG